MAHTETAALITVLTLICFDYATGLLKAVMHKDVSSEKMRQGLFHKSALILVMLLAEIVERAQTFIDLGFTVPLIVPAAVYIVVTETASIIENLGEINPEIKASPLLQLFRSTKTTGKENDTHER